MYWMVVENDDDGTAVVAPDWCRIEKLISAYHRQHIRAILDDISVEAEAFCYNINNNVRV